MRANPPATRRTHTVLASLQVALTLALLVGAALFVKSFWQLARIEPGYQTSEGVTLQLDLPASDLSRFGERRAVDRWARGGAARRSWRASRWRNLEPAAQSDRP